MAKKRPNNRGQFNFAVLGEGAVELFVFEVIGAGPRDGARYVRMKIGGSDYVMDAEVAENLGRMLISAAEQLPTVEFKRDRDEPPEITDDGGGSGDKA